MKVKHNIVNFLEKHPVVRRSFLLSGIAIFFIAYVLGEITFSPLLVIYGVISTIIAIVLWEIP